MVQVADRAGTSVRALTRWGPLVLACAVMLAMSLSVALRADALTRGDFTYALDDAYIHMAIARNVVEHGVFGVTPFEYTAASSSPLWTGLLVAAFGLFGVSDAAPLVLAFALAIVALVVVDAVLVRYRTPPLIRAGLLLVGLWSTPMVPMVFTGMEHMLQLTSTMVVLALAAMRFSLPMPDTRTRPVALACALAVATATRYEALALLATVAVVPLVHRRFKDAALLLSAGVAPPALMAVYSILHGAPAVPNPIVIKGVVSSGLAEGSGGPLSRVWSDFWAGGPLSWLLIMATVAVIAHLLMGREARDPRVVFLGSGLLTALAHLQFAGVGWFYRYEAYLYVPLCMGIVLVGSSLLDSKRASRGARAAIALVLALPVAVAGPGMIDRGTVSLSQTPRAMANIFEQQRQTAAFISANPQWRAVVLNDLGAVAYYCQDVRIVDVVGLGQRVPSPEARSGRLPSAHTINAMAESASATLAVLYPDWVEDRPAHWVPVAEWRVSESVVLGSERVVFYAIPPADPASLRSALERYAEQALPPTVRVSYDVNDRGD